MTKENEPCDYRIGPIDFKYKPDYWIIIPTIGINRSMMDVEFRWLCFAFYVSYIKEFWK